MGHLIRMCQPHDMVLPTVVRHEMMVSWHDTMVLCHKMIISWHDTTNFLRLRYLVTHTAYMAQYAYVRKNTRLALGWFPHQSGATYNGKFIDFLLFDGYQAPLS